MLQDRLELSERRACRVTGQHRSTQRRLPTRGRGVFVDGVLQERAVSPDASDEARHGRYAA